MSPTELYRLYFIIRVFLNYGLDALIPKIGLTFPLQFFLRLFFWIPYRYRNKSLGERLRLALQELGPVWIKFGQMMSTRRDFFTSDIIEQLILLQDRVPPFNSDIARSSIEKAIGGSLEIWFEDFQPQVLASASIAQVHSARMKNTGKELILKIIRPDIEPIIKSDIRLMYRLVDLIIWLIPNSRFLRPREVIREYEKTLLDELNLLREAANTIQLRRNFNGSHILYVPEVYIDYCRKNVLVMERIYGIPISDINALKQQGINLKVLAERGVQVFFTQVFRDSFFHADMHPGNIFVSYDDPEDPSYISIDCGIVGSLNKDDKLYLAGNFIAFFNRDYRKVVELHVDSGWVPKDTNLVDFELAIRTVCEPIFKKPLAEISFGNMLFNLFNIARHFNMNVQPQLVLLQKTLLYIEGLGKQLYPQLDLWTTAKPFLDKWLRDQIGIPAVIRALKEKSPFWIEKLPELPELFYHSLQQNKLLQQSVDKLIDQMKLRHIHHGKSRYLLSIGATLLVSGMVLLLGQVEFFSTWIMVIGLICCMIGLYKML